MPVSAPPVWRTVDDRRRVAALLGAASAPPAVLAGALVGLGAGPAAGGAAALAAGAAAAGVWWRRAGRPAAFGPEGSPADPDRHARLLNLLDGLCASAGVRTPELRVVAVPGANLAAAGRHPSSARVTITAGLLDRLDRVELEAVLAEAVVAIRRRATVSATVAAAVGFGGEWVSGPNRDLDADRGAVTLTRYPPGLASALQACAAAGTVVPGVPRRAAHLWLFHPLAGSSPARRRPLDERVQALVEL